MRRPLLPALLSILLPVSLTSAAAHAITATDSAGRDGASASGGAQPALAYDLGGITGDDVTQGSRPGSYSGRWVGTWQGADGRLYRGDYRGRSAGATRVASTAAPERPAAVASSATPRTQTPGVAPASFRPAERSNAPDPALIGSGTVANGWYYPPAIVTTTVIERAPAHR